MYLRILSVTSSYNNRTNTALFHGFSMVLSLVNFPVLRSLLTVLNEVMYSFDKTIDVDIIYSDIAKAFESVSLAE